MSVRTYGVFQGRLSRSSLDDRIGAVVREPRANPNRYGSIPALAAGAGLSPSRFRHLFTEEMEVSCRQYLLWVRLYNAVCEFASGGTLTEAAHNVGVSDPDVSTHARHYAVGY